MNCEKVCECGCGGFLKLGNRFIVGHNRRGIKLGEEQKQKKSETTKRSWLNLEIRRKRCEGVKKAKNTKKGKSDNLRAGIEGGNKVKQLLQENEQFRKSFIEGAKKGGEKVWREKREYMLKVRKKQWNNKARKKMSISTTKRMEQPGEREKISQYLKEKYSNPIEREKQSIRISEAYLKGKFSIKTWYVLRESGEKIPVQSSYEERFVKILDYFFGIDWHRCWSRFLYFDGVINRNYIPDFVVKKIIFETKGWIDDHGKQKIIGASKNSNLTVYLIFGEQLKLLEELIRKRISKFPFDKLPVVKNGKLNKVAKQYF